MRKGASLILMVFLMSMLLQPGPAAFPVSGAAAAPPNTAAASEEPSFSFDFSAPSERWTQLVTSDAPATFSHVSYEYADSVITVGGQVTHALRSADALLSGSAVQEETPTRIIAQGGYIARDLLDTAASVSGAQIGIGSVVVDPDAGTAFKVVAPVEHSGVYRANAALSESVAALDGTYAVAQPEFDEVLKSFELQEETLALTRGNISGFAPHVEASLADASGYRLLSDVDDFRYLPDDPLIALRFNDTLLNANLGDGQSVSVTVSGQIGIGSIGLTGKYSGFGGYKIAMTVDQETDLSVVLNTDVASEVRIPLFGISVPFGIGEVTGGVFAIIGLDGTLLLEIESQTYTATTMGVSGGTAFYVPTSARPVFDQELKADGDCSLSGNINGYIKVGPMVKMDLFGFDLVGGGAFLGAGVQVATTGHFLDIELRGIFNVYVSLGGKTLNLANYQPVILTRKQADTAGYRIKIMEAFVKPGRVGGIIEQQMDGGAASDYYAPAPGVPYRILVVPDGTAFNPDDPGSIDQASIRKYPESGYATTNGEGEFIQKDDAILFHGDRAYLEFQAFGQSYYSDPVSAVLPFEDVTITWADYFSEYVTGTVQPVRLINWEAGPDDPPDQQVEWVPYDNAVVHLSPYNGNLGVETYGGTAICRTDAHGNFDTRTPFEANGLITENQIDVRPAYQPEHSAAYLWTWFVASLDHNNATITPPAIFFNPTMSLSVNRVIREVEDSYSRVEQDGQIIDEVLYDEYIWIINTAGTRSVRADELDYTMFAFSSADVLHRYDDKDISAAIAAVAGDNKWTTPPIADVQPDSLTVTTLRDEYGEETGSVLVTQRVAARWVWQKHPNPVTITSPDETTVSEGGASFTVTATGYAPFRFSLDGAPADVTIDAAGGVLHIPEGLAPGSYAFTIQAEEDRTQALPVPAGQPDPYAGNDPSDPDEQAFTLIIEEGTAVTPTPDPGPEVLAPVINRDGLTTDLEMDSGGGVFTLPVTASGSEPITWRLVESDPRHPVPDAVSINRTSGVLTVKDTLFQGVYPFTVVAENEAGSDTEPFQMTVWPRTAPVIGERKDEYAFEKLITARPVTKIIEADGSTPIIWSLQKYNAREEIPTSVSIDSKTGILTIGAGSPAGTYFFTIRAENDVGYDLQDCTLTILSFSVLTDAASPSDPASDWMPLAVQSGGSSASFLQDLPVLPPDIVHPPALAAADLSLVCDHTIDVYTKDRQTVNGATYIHWDSLLDITLEGVTYRQTVADTSPACDKYHYSDPLNISPDVMDRIRDLAREELTEPADDLFGPGGWNPDVLSELNEHLGQPDPFFDEMADRLATYLDYGIVLDEMDRNQNGMFTVDLNERTGTRVSGALFTGLQNHPDAQLLFKQENATLLFDGNDVRDSTSFEMDLYDFAYASAAPHEAAMLASAGVPGDTFSFAHHGPLPGTATFRVQTSLDRGARAQVYRYSPEEDVFSLIASDVPVAADGFVTYRNNTLSEYLVTTEILPGAAISDMVDQQEQSGRHIAWFLAGAAVLAGAAAVLLVRKKKNGSGPQNS